MTTPTYPARVKDRGCYRCTACLRWIAKADLVQLVSEPLVGPLYHWPRQPSDEPCGPVRLLDTYPGRDVEAPVPTATLTLLPEGA